MRVFLSLEVGYEKSTVKSESLLVNALHQELHRFVEAGGLTPYGEEVVDTLEYGVSIVKDPCEEQGVIRRIQDMLGGTAPLEARVLQVLDFCEGYKR